MDDEFIKTGLTFEFPRARVLVSKCALDRPMSERARIEKFAYETRWFQADFGRVVGVRCVPPTGLRSYTPICGLDDSRRNDNRNRR
jgi:hypothetical protein